MNRSGGNSPKSVFTLFICSIYSVVVVWPIGMLIGGMSCPGGMNEDELVLIIWEISAGLGLEGDEINMVEG